MSLRGFLRSGHTPTLFSAFLYFDLSFMVWVLLGPLGVAISKSLHLDAGQKGLMVATPLLAGAVLRVVLGVLVDHVGPKSAGIASQLIVLAGLGAAWFLGVHSYGQVLILAVLLGVAGASFAVALPLASRWYPPEQQGLALGVVGAMGGFGGFYLASTLGFAKQLTGAYQAGFLGFAALALIALSALLVLKGRRRARWPTLYAGAGEPAPVRV